MNAHPRYTLENEGAYLDLLAHVTGTGEVRKDRTGTGTVSVFAPEAARYDLRYGFPVLTTKRIAWRAVVGELLWFLRGDTNAWELQAEGIKIWDEWANPNTGELGPIYGAQWRGRHLGWKFAPDQIAGVLESLKRDPYGRRHLVSAWNVVQLREMKLPPCHFAFQFYVHQPDGPGKPGLSVQVYQRSADLFLGVPFNVASYALLLAMFAEALGYEAREVIHVLGDAHVYRNHLDQVTVQLAREPRDPPRLVMDSHVGAAVRELRFRDLRIADFRLEGYDPHPPIKAPVAV